MHPDIKVRDLVRRRGDHVNGRVGGQTGASQVRGRQGGVCHLQSGPPTGRYGGLPLPRPSPAPASTPPAVRPVAGRRTGGSWPLLPERCPPWRQRGRGKPHAHTGRPCHSHARRRRPIASTATAIPRRVAGAGRSKNQIRGSVLGARTWGGTVARLCGQGRTRGEPLGV